ncbi:hypothetical protein GCM10009588_03610 [Microbacterium phyllosphaerae]
MTFLPAALALRPPRVVIVFPDDHHWRDWVMRALEISSDHWGGGGFILVPYAPETGEPSARFTEIVRAYDPDHVVTLELPVPELEEWYPGTISVSPEVSPEDRPSFIRMISDEISMPESARARDVVASWCSPMRDARMLPDQPLRPRETHDALRAVRRDDRFNRGLPVSPEPALPVLAASASWRTDLGLFAAARVGVVADHDDERRAEPGSDVVEWSVRRDGAAPASLIHSPESSSVPVTEVSTLFDSDPGLIRVTRGYTRDKVAIVVGDTGTDFALAVAYDRLLGRGHWVTPAMLDDAEILSELRSSLWWVVAQLRQHASFLTVCSSSLDDEAVSAVAISLQQPRYEFERYGRLSEKVEEERTVQTRTPRLDRGNSELIVEEYVGTSVIVPMAALADGTMEAMTELDAPTPSTLMYPLDSGKVPYWYVDVSFARAMAPPARDLPSSAVLITRAPDWPYPEVTLRTSKDGITFNPSSLGFVAGNSFLPARLGRPRLRSLSMRAWVEGMANAAGLGVRVSAPGRHSELVSRRLGSRDALLDLVVPSRLPMLRAFVPHTSVPKKREPGNVVIGLDPYLSFEKMSSLMGSEPETRQLVDQLSAARLLRRGLVLGCTDCERPSFVDLDRAGQQYECPQCAASNTLTSSRWRAGSEPLWHFDLYAPFRELMRGRGDIPVLAAAQLRRDSRTYADAPELEFFDLDSGKPVAEVDVIARSDERVVLVEAKAAGAFAGKHARGDQTEKLLRVARALHADAVVLATTREAWSPADLNHVQQEGAKVRPFPVHVSAMTDLANELRAAL